MLAGITSFITVAYILILNPQILSHPYTLMGDGATAGSISNGVFIGTCIASFLGTILCALYARVPFVQAPGMGLNAFFAYTAVLAMGYSYAETLVVVFISGIFFILITKIGLQEAIIRAIPDSVINAVTPGADLSGLCGALVALVGLIVIGVLYIKKVRGSIFIGIIAATLVGIPLGVTSFEGFSFDIGSKFADFFEVSFFNLDFVGLFSGKIRQIKPLTVVISLIFIARYAFITLG